MTEYSPAEAAVTEHLINLLGQMIVDAASVAVQQENSAERTSGRWHAKHLESAEFHQALAARITDLAKLAKREFYGADSADAFPGQPGSRWRDDEGDLWIHGDDGRMWAVNELEEPDDPDALEQHLGPMAPVGGES
jgi:hypothetical protein